MRLCLLIVLALPLSARVNVTTVAAVTTITINAIEIKQTISKMVKITKKVKKVVVKTAKKVIH